MSETHILFLKLIEHYYSNDVSAMPRGALFFVSQNLEVKFG